MNEKELIEKCKSGEKDAFKKLYETYSQYAMGICFRYTGDEMLAEDVLHDGFIRVFAAIHSFQYREEGSLKAWLKRIFCNESLYFLKKNKLWNNFIPIQDYDVPEEEPDISSWRTIPKEVLMQYISRLSVGYRIVFNLYMFENLSHKEIGKQLGIKEEASRSRLSRAKAILTKQIKEYISKHA
ncbi:MAG: sigma-70 family RNA polymerase sigma factor [Dysgonamonadaceae bacterium]|jgi:RNA polymerase sigma-70 factor (ECF subfamily)|nr:sigma-70 family RNA polymerase sigma factor [Dysgonamonadaceae bacterium]